jgi:hypothetical protein
MKTTPVRKTFQPGVPVVTGDITGPGPLPSGCETPENRVL